MSEQARGRDRVAIAARVLLALLAVLAFLTVRSELEAGTLTAARFALGVLLFGLLADLGRSIAGTGRSLRGRLAPHRQRAQAQVDETYDRLREALDAYIDEGRILGPLPAHVRQAAHARELSPERVEQLTDRLREAGGPGGSDASLLAVHLSSGFVLTVGLSFAVALLAENLGMALVPAVLLVAGTSLAMLQWRAHASGAAWVGATLGLVGVVLFGLGALRIFSVSPAAGTVLLALALGGLIATAWNTWHTRRTGPARRGRDLEASMRKLRRAFLLFLVAGIVVFALQPLFTGLLEALGLPGSLAMELSAVAFVTVGAFLSIELAGTWLAIRHGRRGHQREQSRRRQALETVLDEIDQAQGGHP